MKPLTIERRLTLWSALIVFVSLLVCGALNALYLQQRAISHLDHRLHEVAEHFFFQRQLHGGPDFQWTEIHEIQEWLPHEGSREWVEVRRGDTPVFRSAMLGDVVLPRTSGERTSMNVAGRKMRVGVFQSEEANLTVLTPYDPVEDLTRDLAIIFAIGAPASMLIAYLGGRWIAAKVLGPVREIAASAERISSCEPSLRVPVPEADDDLRRMALVLNDALGRLEASLLQARRFSADASHELRTPLAALRAELEALLRSATIPPDDRAGVAGALETTNRLVAITKTLLALARADAGKLEVVRQPIDLAEILSDCVDDARISAGLSQVDIECEHPDSAGVSGDRSACYQIIGNLLENAVKFNRAGGRVRVTLTGENGDWLLDIANTGLQIPIEERAQLFERFSRAQHHAEVPGQGLGLSLARELARAHGGAVELLRSDENWTVFRFRIGKR